MVGAAGPPPPSVLHVLASEKDGRAERGEVLLIEVEREAQPPRSYPGEVDHPRPQVVLHKPVEAPWLGVLEEPDRRKVGKTDGMPPATSGKVG